MAKLLHDNGLDARIENIINWEVNVTMDNMNLGQPFKVSIKNNCSYYDPNYASLKFNIQGEIELSSPDYGEGQSTTEYVNSVMDFSLNTVLMKYSNENKSYQEILSSISDIESAVSQTYRERRFDVLAFKITSFDLLPEYKARIDQMEAMKAKAQSLSQEEFKSKLDEAYEAALQAANTGNQTTQMNQTNVANPVNPAMSMNYPKFCTNCGTPTTGSNFCPNCGNRLRQV
ncbi:MAG: hypothetical protein K6E10_03975 [Eubacterium sp.]|nr:hypothetical protein [Eubacterium sp.]